MKRNEILKLLGKSIKQCREQKGLTQEELGFLCNLHRQQISMIERGLLDLRYLTLLKIFNILNIPKDLILYSTKLD